MSQAKMKTILEVIDRCKVLVLISTLAMISRGLVQYPWAGNWANFFFLLVSMTLKPRYSWHLAKLVEFHVHFTRVCRALRGVGLQNLCCRSSLVYSSWLQAPTSQARHLGWLSHNLSTLGLQQQVDWTCRRMKLSYQSASQSQKSWRRANDEKISTCPALLWCAILRGASTFFASFSSLKAGSSQEE